MKRCFKCGEEKPIQEFSIHRRMKDGHLNKCKACARDYARLHRKEINPSYYKPYEDSRWDRPDRVAARKAYQRTDRGRAALAIASRRFAEKYPEKRSAHCAVANALRGGKLQRLPCEVCGTTKAHAHHDDYSKPLVVRWLCAVHHAEHHKAIRRKLTGVGPGTPPGTTKGTHDNG